VKNLSHVSAKNDALRANVLKTDYSVHSYARVRVIVHKMF